MQKLRNPGHLVNQPDLWDVFYAWTCAAFLGNGGANPDATWHPTKLNSGTVSSVNPSLCLYKNGPEVRVGITWEDDPKLYPATQNISFASVKTETWWHNTLPLWTPTVVAITHDDILSTPSTPVITPWVAGSSGPDQNGPLGTVMGLDSLSVLDPAVHDAKEAGKVLLGFLIAFAHTHAQAGGVMQPPCFEGALNASDPCGAVVSGIYYALVDKDALKNAPANRCANATCVLTAYKGPLNQNDVTPAVLRYTDLPNYYPGSIFQTPALSSTVRLTPLTGQFWSVSSVDEMGERSAEVLRESAGVVRARRARPRSPGGLGETRRDRGRAGAAR